MIPQDFHFVWIGDNPLPDNMRAWAKSWKTHNPDWSLNLWIDRATSGPLEPFDNVRQFPALINEALYKKIGHYVGVRPTIAARSDIVRYELIARFGGVYLDTDVECFGPIAELLVGVKLFISDEMGPSPGNYMFGAEPNHPAMWTMVREIEGECQTYFKEKMKPQIEATGGYDHVNPVIVTGPHYLNKQLRKHPDLVTFPSQLFNPLSAWDDYKQVKNWPESAYGNHHFAGTWYDRNKKTPPKDFL